MALLWRRMTFTRIAIGLESLVISDSCKFYHMFNPFEKYLLHRLSLFFNFRKLKLNVNNNGIILTMKNMTSFDTLNAIELDLFDEKLIHSKNENESYKYRIGIDIQSIYNLSKPFNIICKYKPSILINKSEGKSIKNGFCAHKIILKSNKLKTDKSTSNL